MESVPPKKDDVCGTRERFSTGILMAVPSALSLEPQTLVSPHMTLACSTLPLPEAMESVYQLSFLWWSFKKMPVSLTEFHLFLTDRFLLIFRLILCKYFFLALVLRAGDPSMGLRPHDPQRELPRSWISLLNLSHHP